MWAELIHEKTYRQCGHSEYLHLEYDTDENDLVSMINGVLHGNVCSWSISRSRQARAELDERKSVQVVYLLEYLNSR